MGEPNEDPPEIQLAELDAAVTVRLTGDDLRRILSGKLSPELEARLVRASRLLEHATLMRRLRG